MSDPSVTRGKFLRSLGSSVANMALGSGIGMAAKALNAGAKAVAKTPPPPASPNAMTPDVPFFESGPVEGKNIALTFDDGPTPGVTEIILDELKARNLHATFFMIGQKAVAAPELARRVLAGGHEIGNHTFTHPKLTTLPDRQVETEIAQTQATLAEILGGSKPRWFRPPYGELRKSQAVIPQRMELGVVMWSIDSRDWDQTSGSKIVDTILTQAAPGAIVLCHDLHAQTASAIGSILDGLLELHYNFITVSTLLGRHHFAP